MEMHYYTNERNHQIVIALLKAHNIRYVVASPGSCNSVFVGSIQHDEYFTIYSAVDERSAAYIACGLALESGEPVVITCTGATAARNYMSGTTEAYYSKLPILILTSSQPNNRVGHLYSQVTDRTSPPNDTCKLSETLPIINTKDEEWECEVKVNNALLELRRHGGGPVHLNLVTSYSYSEITALTQKTLPLARVIRRFYANDVLPELPHGKIAIFVGSHKPWTKTLVSSVERFCRSSNAVVLVDHTSNYHGQYKIPIALQINQAPLNQIGQPAFEVDLLIHIGEVSGEEGVVRMIKGHETWRVSEDGELRDTFRNLTNVFEFKEELFFNKYSENERIDTAYFEECNISYQKCYLKSREQLKFIPFSNVWVGAHIAPLIPDGSSVVLSILNTLRTWNYSVFKENVNVYSTVGGFGIDGTISTMLGVSLSKPSKPCYCIVGDLAFFYDLNTVGNRHISNNIRIMLINNGIGVEFKKRYALAYRLLGNDVDSYVAAAGHFGNKSSVLVKHFSEDLGFEYIAASNKEEFEDVYRKFVSEEITDKPLLFEVFIDPEEDMAALDIIHNRK